MRQEWAELDEFPGYSISVSGVVINDSTGRIIKRIPGANGAPLVGMMKNGIQIKRQVNTLMVATWLFEDWPEHFDTPIHLDGDKENCAVDNLTVRPRWFAIMFHKESVRDPFPDWKQPIEVVETGRVFSNPKECARRYGVLQKDIWRWIETDRTVFPLGWHFKFST